MKNEMVEEENFSAILCFRDIFGIFEIKKFVSKLMLYLGLCVESEGESEKING